MKLSALPTVTPTSGTKIITSQDGGGVFPVSAMSDLVGGKQTDPFCIITSTFGNMNVDTEVSIYHLENYRTILEKIHDRASVDATGHVNVMMLIPNLYYYSKLPKLGTKVLINAMLGTDSLSGSGLYCRDFGVDDLVAMTLTANLTNINRAFGRNFTQVGTFGSFTLNKTDISSGWWSGYDSSHKKIEEVYSAANDTVFDSLNYTRLGSTSSTSSKVCNITYNFTFGGEATNAMVS